MTRQMADDEVLRVLAMARVCVANYPSHDPMVHAGPMFDPAAAAAQFDAAVAALQAERDALRAEQEHNNALIQRQSDLLTGAVNVLRGDPPSDTLWSHHDVAELAREMKARAERAESALETLRGQVAGVVEKWQAESNALPTLSHKGAGLDRGIKELSELLAIKERMG